MGPPATGRPPFPGRIPRPDVGFSGPCIKLPAHGHNRLPTSTAAEPFPPGPQKSQVRTQVSGELQALLTSGPGGDGFPGVGLIIGGVIAIQIHPIVIWVDLGRGPVPLWSHLIRGTSRGLKKINMAVSFLLAPTPASLTVEEGWGSAHRLASEEKPKGSGLLFNFKKSHHIHNSESSLSMLK